MQFEFSVWLYGLRSGSTKTSKKLERLSSDDFSSARAFHVFVRKSPRSKWKRLTDEPEYFPSSIKSASNKELFVDTFIDIVNEEIRPSVKEKKAPKKKTPKVKKEEKSLEALLYEEFEKLLEKDIAPKAKPPRPPKTPTPKEKTLEELLQEDFEELMIEIPEEEEVKEIILPETPEPTRATLTRKQFEAQMARILMDELDGDNIKWSKNRFENFIKKMWRGYGHAPHLVSSEFMRRRLVSQELVRIKKSKRPKVSMDDTFRKKLQNKEITLDVNIGGKAEVKFKEVFNMQQMRKKDESTMTVIEDGYVVEKDRQTAFAQVVVDYDKSIMINAVEALGSKKVASKAFSKVREDITKVFNDAMEKGVFREGDEPEYAIRLLVPLVDSKGRIPTEHLSRKNETSSGHGYSTTRHRVKDRKDLDALLDGMFKGLLPAMARYVRLNNSVGYMIAGFMIERLIR